MYHNRIAECIDKDSNTGKIKILGIYDTVTKKYAIIELNNYRTKKIEDVVELKHIKNILSEVGNDNLTKDIPTTTLEEELGTLLVEKIIMVKDYVIL